MGNPLERLKRLPWRSLFQAALITVLAITLLEFLLALAAQLPVIRSVLITLFQAPLGILTALAIAAGIGALAVYILERLDRPVISSGSLWALTLCLGLSFLLQQLLPLPFGLFELNYTQFVALVVGVFWKGRPYWQSFRRW
jgi:branched-subunit amino acid ABC-type transport system permease component